MITEADLQLAGSRFERRFLIQGEMIRRPDMEFTGLDISRVKFDNLDLRRRSFKGATGYIPYLRKATFRKCDFSESNLRGAYFSYSNLEKCDFRNSTLTHCHFWRCTMDGVNFDGATLVDCDFEEVDTSKIRWGSAKLINPRGLK
jgi:uncharacterized protein YjbI with pentapeptide repeats